MFWVFVSWNITSSINIASLYPFVQFKSFGVGFKIYLCRTNLYHLVVFFSRSISPSLFWGFQPLLLVLLFCSSPLNVLYKKRKQIYTRSRCLEEERPVVFIEYCIKPLFLAHTTIRPVKGFVGDMSLRLAPMLADTHSPPLAMKPKLNLTVKPSMKTTSLKNSL